MKNTDSNNFSLVVDLDNSLLKIDLFEEILGKALLKHPLLFLKTLMFAIKSKALAKTFISKACNIDWHTLPFNREILDIITNYRKKGYKILLATGSPEGYAHPIADHLGMFDAVIATDESTNNVGLKKLEAIIKEVGNNFIYMGDSYKDLPVWLHCKKSILVGDNSSIKKKLISNNVEIINIIKKEKSIIKVLLKQMRVQQWIKNLLLFVPAIASHRITEVDVLFNNFSAFFAFSLLASSIYVLNDIVDLDHDRKHPKKKTRPIAAGDLNMFRAYGVFSFCFLIGFLLSISINTLFFFTVFVYVVMNILYSFYLKRFVILDVMLLMSFYSLRIIAGQIPDSIPFSQWLLSFSMFIFFSLGLLKRYVDTKVMKDKNITFLSGRGYKTSDGNLLMILGVGSGLISVLILMLYTSSQNVQKLYETPILLIGTAPLMIYWIARLWFKAERGEISEDPVLFTIKDKTSYLVAFLLLIITIAATIQI